MKHCLLRKIFILLLLCLVACSVQAQTLALFRVVENGDTRIYDSATHSYLTYNKADTVIANRHITRSVIDASGSYGVAVSVRLDKEGTERFAKATRESVGKQIAIVLGTRLITAPTVSGEITDGKLQIAYHFTYEEAKALANVLRQKNQRRSVDPLDDVKAAIKKLDVALVLKDYEVLYELLSESLLMGHSNAHFQTKNDVITDLRENKIVYEKIEQQSIQEHNPQKNVYRVSRIIEVRGKYRGSGFNMTLAVMEIWLDDENEEANNLQLWSRQAVKIKD